MMFQKHPMIVAMLAILSGLVLVTNVVSVHIWEISNSDECIDGTGLDVPCNRDISFRFPIDTFDTTPTKITKDSVLAVAYDIRIVSKLMITKYHIKDKSVASLFQSVVDHIDQLVLEIRRTNGVTFEQLAEHYLNEISKIQEKTDDYIDKFSPEDSLKSIVKSLKEKATKLNGTNHKWTDQLNKENRSKIASQFELVQTELDSVIDTLLPYNVSYSLKYSQSKLILMTFKKEIDDIETHINDLLFKYNLQFFMFDIIDTGTAAAAAAAPYTKEWIHSRLFRLKGLIESLIERFKNDAKIKQIFNHHLDYIDVFINKFNHTYVITPAIGKEQNQQIEVAEENLLSAIRRAELDPKPFYQMLVKGTLNDEADRIRSIANQIVEKFKANNKSISVVFELVISELDSIKSQINQTNPIVKELVEHFRNEIDMIELKTQRLIEQYDREDTAVGIKEQLVKKIVELRTICNNSIKKSQLTNKTILVSKFELILLEVDTLDESIHLANAKEILLVYRKEAENIEKSLDNLLKLLTNDTVLEDMEIFLAVPTVDPELLTKDFLIAMATDIQNVSKTMMEKFSIPNKSVSQIFGLVEEHLAQLIDEIKATDSGIFSNLAKHFYEEINNIQLKINKYLEQFSPDDSLTIIAERLSDRVKQLNGTNQNWVQKLAKENRTSIASQFELIQAEIDSYFDLFTNYTIDNTIKYSQSKSILVVYQKELTQIEIRQNDLIAKYNLKFFLFGSSSGTAPTTWAPYTVEWLQSRALKLKELTNRLMNQFKNTTFEQQFFFELNSIDYLIAQINKTHAFTVVIGKQLNEKINKNEQNFQDIVQRTGLDPKPFYQTLSKEALNDEAERVRSIANQMVVKFQANDKSVSTVFELVIEQLESIKNEINQTNPIVENLVEHFRNEIDMIGLKTQRLIDQYAGNGTAAGIKERLVEKIIQLRQICNNSIERLHLSNKAELVSEFELILLEVNTLDESVQSTTDKAILLVYQNEAEKIENTVVNLLKLVTEDTLEIFLAVPTVDPKRLTKAFLLNMATDIQNVSKTMMDKFAVSNKSVSQIFELAEQHLGQLVEEIKATDEGIFSGLAEHFYEKIYNIQQRIYKYLEQFSPDDSLTIIAEKLSDKVKQLNGTNQKWLKKLYSENRTLIASQFELIQVELDSFSDLFTNYTIDYSIQYSQSKQVLMVFQKEISQIEIWLNDLLAKYNLKFLIDENNLSAANSPNSKFIDKETMLYALDYCQNQTETELETFQQIEKIDFLVEKFQLILQEIVNTKNEIEKLDNEHFKEKNELLKKVVQSIEDRLILLVQRFPSKSYYHDGAKSELIHRLVQIMQTSVTELKKSKNDSIRVEQFKMIIEETEQMTSLVIQMMNSHDMVQHLMSIFKPAVDRIELQLKDMLSSESKIMTLFQNNDQNITKEMIIARLDTLKKQTIHYLDQFKSGHNTTNDREAIAKLVKLLLDIDEFIMLTNKLNLENDVERSLLPSMMNASHSLEQQFDIWITKYNGPYYRDEDKDRLLQKAGQLIDRAQLAIDSMKLHEQNNTAIYQKLVVYHKRVQDIKLYVYNTFSTRYMVQRLLSSYTIVMDALQNELELLIKQVPNQQPQLEMAQSLGDRMHQIQQSIGSVGTKIHNNLPNLPSSVSDWFQTIKSKMHII